MYKISASGSSVVSPAWDGSIVLCSYCSVAKLCPTLPPNGQQHARLLWPVSQSLLKFMSTGLVMLSNHFILCPILFFFCLQTFPAPGSFPRSWFFVSNGQSIGASASATVLPMNIQGWFPLRIDWFDLHVAQGPLKNLLQHHNLKASILCHSAFFIVQLVVL